MGRIARAHGESGAALVEMAIALPLLIFLIVGIWGTARAWNVHNVIDHAAREAARFGATVDPWDPATSPASVRGVADMQLGAAGIPVAAVTDCIDLGADPCGADPSNAVSDDVVAVELRYPNYKIEFVFFSITVPALQSTAVSRYES